MSNATPTSRERQFLRAIAAVNPARPGDTENWWSVSNLQATRLFPDMQDKTSLVIAGLGRSCARKGMAVSRNAGQHGHRSNRWAEWRISSFGRGLVADSCIGGGLTWPASKSWPEPDPRCPACKGTMADLGITGPLPAEIPAHPLPGYTTENIPEGGN